MSKKRTTTAIATVDTNASSFIDLLKQRLASLETISNTPFKCGGNIKTSDGNTIDITTETDTAKWIRLAGTVLIQEDAYNKGVAALKLDKCPAFRYAGSYDPESIIHDCALRIRINSIEEERNSLKQDIERASAFISEEEKRENFFRDMEAKYNK